MSRCWRVLAGSVLLQACIARERPSFRVPVANGVMKRDQLPFAVEANEDPTMQEIDSASEDADDESVMTDLWKAWNSTIWPLPGKERCPPENMNSSRLLGLKFGAVLLALILAMICCLGLASRAIHTHKNSKWKFVLHFQALFSAIVWRHLHQRAICLHVIRIAVPSLILFLMEKIQTFLLEQSSKKDTEEMLKAFGVSRRGAVDSILEYTMTVAMVYIVMMAMLFFVWHVAAESQSGFRHLLHVSGLSRSAYILATAGVDGVAQAFLGIILMLVVSGSMMQVRLVLWSSTVLLLVTLWAMAVSAIMLGYLLCFLCPSLRFSSNAAQFILALVICIAPFTPLSPVVPPVGQQSWLALAMPVIPASRGLFELVVACIKGRCLSLEDVKDALVGRTWAGPQAMIVGSSATAAPMTPPGAWLSFIGLVLLQLTAGCLLIVMLDRRQNPALHESNKADTLKVSNSEHQAGNSLLEVSNLEHSYNWLSGIQSGTQTLKGVSFQISRGEMLGLLGPNGAGKTTAIRCITGEEAPTKGSVAIASSSPGGTCIGLCPQETIVNGDLTVLENILFFALVRGASGEDSWRCTESILRATHLEEKRDALPDALSGGMRRRLAVGCAMVATPAVVILDEPTTGLDPVNRRGIWETIAQVKEAGGCCLLTTHMLEEAEHLASQIVILRKGLVAAEGSVQKLKQEWGMGYLLSVDSAANKEEEAAEFIKSLLSPEDRTPVKSQRYGQATYKFSKDGEALGNLIISIARGKANNSIRHWGISQASLEDAYVRIIQEEE